MRISDWSSDVCSSDLFWRLFYTAFSRAQNLLVLAAQEKQGRGRSPSKYFDRLFYELPSWRDIDLAALSYEAVKQINLKREYSFTSHITVFENCAKQYRFFKALEFRSEGRRVGKEWVSRCRSRWTANT